MLERLSLVYLALATIVAAALLPVPVRTFAFASHDDRQPTEPPAPLVPSHSPAPRVVADQPLAECTPCGPVSLVSNVITGEVAGVIVEKDVDAVLEQVYRRTDAAADPEADAELVAEMDEMADAAVDVIGELDGEDDAFDLALFEPAPSKGQALADLAGGLAGLPYRWGGISPATGFDCSGLVYYVHRQMGASLNRDAASQFANGRAVGRADMQPGDIVFFADTYTSGISHDGIYLGGGRFVHAVSPGSGVRISAMGDGYWSPRFAGARRVFE